MSKVLKIVLGLFGLLIVLVLAAVIIIPLVVDPNDYRHHIEQAVEEQTGRSFEIEGEISLSVFPWLGLEVGRMRLGNPPGFGDQPFAEIGSAALGARLLPLLSRRLEVSTLRLDGLRVHLVQLEDGRNNWDDLGEDAAEPAVERPADDGTFRLERVDGLRLTDAVLRYEDRAEGSVAEIVIPRISTSEIVPGRPISIEAEAALALDEGRTRLGSELAATLHIADGPAAGLEGLRLRFEASGPDVPGGAQAGELRADTVALDLDAQTLGIPAWRLDFAGLEINGEVTGSSIVDAPAFAGGLEVAEFAPRALLQRLGEDPPVTADAAVLGRASLQARFQATTDEFALEDLRIVLDDTVATGTATLGLGEITRVRAQLSLDAIDADRYLPPETEEPVEPPPSEDTPLAFEWLEGLDLDAALRIGRLLINGLTLNEIEARAVARNGVLSVEPFGAALYGGQVRGSARLDARRTPATFSLEQTLTALQLEPFVMDLAGFDRLTGVARLEARLSTTAASTAGLLSGLGGELSFDVSDGAYKGVNLWFEIQRANALARGRSAPERSSRDTEFRQLKGTAVIRDGVLSNQDLVGGLPFLGLQGRGEIDLAEAALDYRLTATVIREAVDEATGERSELAGLSVPLRLSGALDSPSVSVEVAGLLRERATQEALRRLGVEEEDAKSLQDDVKDRASEAVRSLRDRLRRDD
jgi:AsmA protein